MKRRVLLGLAITSRGTPSATSMLKAALYVACQNCATTTAASSSSSKFQSATNRMNAAFATNSPTMMEYTNDKAFDDPFMRMLFEGIDVDYKQAVRDALLAIVPPRETNFTARADAKAALQMKPHAVVMRQLKDLSKKGLISFAKYKSTPSHFLSLYEVLATCSASLALSAAEHYTFGAFVAQYGRPNIQREVLHGIDDFTVVGTTATSELAADEAPYNTEARWDVFEGHFTLRGAAKIPVVNAATAEWAVVTATVTVGKRTNRGTHLFFVRLRQNGQPIPGVTIRLIDGEENNTLEGCGAGVVHFHEVRLSRENMMNTWEISSAGEVTPVAGVTEELPFDVLNYQRRLATGAMYVGMLKSALTASVHYSARRFVVGPDGNRRHPLLGVQSVQTACVDNLISTIMHLFAWLALQPAITNPHRSPTAEDLTRLAGVVHFLQQDILQVVAYSGKVLGPHHAMQSTLMHAASTMVSLRREGVDGSKLLREVAHRSVTLNHGTTHWGWRAANVLRSFASLDRFIKNPFYTPRVADLGRHLLFFSHKHFGVKQRLQRSREIERRSGAVEHMWYDWTMFRHLQVKHCGEAYMEQHLMDVIMQVAEKAYDMKARRLLRDIGWTFAVLRIVANLDYHLQERLLPLSKSIVATSHLDNMATVIAAQALNLVNILSIPERWCPPAGSERYWTIPGTTTGVERSEAVEEYVEPSKADSNKKEDQESLVEEEKERDLLHGLAESHPALNQKKP